MLLKIIALHCVFTVNDTIEPGLIELNGTSLDSMTGITWTQVVGQNFMTTFLEVEDGIHRVSHPDPSMVFHAMLSGASTRNSYALVAGSSVSMQSISTMKLYLAKQWTSHLK